MQTALVPVTPAHSSRVPENITPLHSITILEISSPLFAVCQHSPVADKYLFNTEQIKVTDSTVYDTEEQGQTLCQSVGLQCLAYRKDGRNSILGKGNLFSIVSSPDLGPTQSPCPYVQEVLCMGRKRPELITVTGDH
jgi:hypothetical protein